MPTGCLHQINLQTSVTPSSCFATRGSGLIETCPLPSERVNTRPLPNPVLVPDNRQGGLPVSFNHLLHTTPVRRATCLAMWLHMTMGTLCQQKKWIVMTTWTYSTSKVMKTNLPVSKTSPPSAAYISIPIPSTPFLSSVISIP